MNRQERKRSQEKRRRLDFKNVMDKLSQVLHEYDEDFHEEYKQRERLMIAKLETNNSRRSTTKKKATDISDSLLFNRIELVNQAIFTIKRMTEENILYRKTIENSKMMTNKNNKRPAAAIIDAIGNNNNESLSMLSSTSIDEGSDTLMNPIKRRKKVHYHQGIGPIYTDESFSVSPSPLTSTPQQQQQQQQPNKVETEKDLVLSSSLSADIKNNDPLMNLGGSGTAAAAAAAVLLNQQHQGNLESQKLLQQHLQHLQFEDQCLKMAQSYLHGGNLLAALTQNNTSVTSASSPFDVPVSSSSLVSEEDEKNMKDDNSSLSAPIPSSSAENNNNNNNNSDVDATQTSNLTAAASALNNLLTTSLFPQNNNPMGFMNHLLPSPVTANLLLNATAAGNNNNTNCSSLAK